MVAAHKKVLAEHGTVQRPARSCHGNVHSRMVHGVESGQDSAVPASEVAVSAAGGETGCADVAEAKQPRTRIEGEVARRTKSWCQKVEMASGTEGP